MALWPLVTLWYQWRFWGLHFGWGGSGVAIIAAGGTDLYCHSEPPLTSGKLCFIINFIGGHRGARIFYWGPQPHLASPSNHPCMVYNTLKGLTAKRLNRNAMLRSISCIQQIHYVTLVMALLFTVRRPGYG